MSENLKIKKVNIKWALDLMREGTIVNLRMSRWRGTSSINPEDLGIKFKNQEVEKFFEKYIKFGTEKIIPKDFERKIHAVEIKARKNIQKYSFKTMWGPFIPYQTFGLWEKENSKIREEYFEVAEELSTNYEGIKNIIKHEYRKLGEDVWDRLYPNQGEPTESFLNSFTNKIVNKMPTLSDLMSSFKYDTVFLQIPVPSIIQDDLNKAEDLRRNNEMKEAMHIEGLKSKDKINQYYVEKKTELIDNFLEDTLLYFRTYIGETCESVLSYMVNGNEIQEINIGKINQIRKFIKKIEQLNFFDDKEISDLIFILNTEIQKITSKRNKYTIVSTLNELVKASKREYVLNNFNPSISTIDI